MAATKKRAKDGTLRGVGNKNKGAGRPKGSKTRPRYIHDYAELGDPPSDPLAATEWAFRANAVAMREVMLDERIAPEKRRADIRTISRTMVTLLPKARLAQVERMLKGDAGKVRSTKPSAMLQPVPPATTPEPTRVVVAAPSARLVPVPPEKDKP